MTKVKGVLRTQFTDKELAIPNPEFYRRVWDANDIVTPAHGGESGGFFLLTNVIITPNQTRGLCPEVCTALLENIKNCRKILRKKTKPEMKTMFFLQDKDVAGAQCKKDSDCPVGKALKRGHGVLTGKCILTTDRNVNVRTCEIEAWCPIERSRPPL